MKKESPFLKASSLVFLLLLICGCQSKQKESALPLLNSEGVVFDSSEWKQNKGSVLIFLSPECPLCQSYSLTIRNLQAQFEKDGIKFYGVIPDKRFSNSEVNAFKTKYELNIPLLRDNEKRLTHQFKATITPEAFLLDNKGNIRYSGRIDNWMYEVGKKRTVITEHDLEYAIKAFLSNYKFKSHHSQAIGCFIE